MSLWLPRRMWGALQWEAAEGAASYAIDKTGTEICRLASDLYHP